MTESLNPSAPLYIPPTTEEELSHARSADSSQLLKMVETTVNTVSAFLGPERPVNLAPKDATLALHVLKSTADTTWTVAETARIEAATRNSELAARRRSEAPQILPESIQRLTEALQPTAEPTKSTTDVLLPRVIKVRIPKQKNVDGGAPVVNGLVGSISREMWEEMSEDHLRQLDDVLRKIVERVCVPDISWEAMGSMIQEDLAAFGLQFNTFEEVLARRPHRSPVVEAGSSDLTRVISAVECCMLDLGVKWYAIEMLQVVQRLMELLGFQT